MRGSIRTRAAYAAALVGALAGSAYAAGNPLMQPSPLPFEAPPFNRIRDADFKPAIDAGIRRERAEILRIADNPAPPTFQNTLVALEASGRLLNRVLGVFNALTSANTDPALQKVQAEEATPLAELDNALYLNAKLFARVKAVYRHRAALKSVPEAQALVRLYYRRFVMNGARLAPAAQRRLAALNDRLARLTTQFQQKLLAATDAGALVITRRSELAGLTPGMIAAAAHAAEARGMPGKWVITLQSTTQQPALAYLSERAVRHALFEHSWDRTEHGGPDDTRRTIETMARLRALKAHLLGYPDFAAYRLQSQMAHTPAAVEHFLAELVPPTVAAVQREARILQAQIVQDGGHFRLRPWDWAYYVNRAEAVRYHLSDAEVRPYLVLHNVITRGLFYLAHRLYGITFKARHDLPVYEKDVRVFEVYDGTGTPLGLIYFDYFRRANKSGGAWMDNFVVQSTLLHHLPVVYNVANFTPPAPGHPALISIDDAVTMFHEFGHGLNSLFADEVYPSLSGTNTARDFVEFPSQFDERWALYPAVLRHYALNDRTGEPMPVALMDKILRARNFNAGYSVGEELAAAELDMEWHTLPWSAPLENADTFERAALKRTGLALADVPPRYRSSFFPHIWGGGYAAGYYSYFWTEMLADDAYDWFLRHGGPTRANGQRFRDLILSRGHTEGYWQMFRSFYGRNPRIGPLLRYHGLVRSAAH
jgi:peptidyl-dipeptidase Dcp